jgi:DNA topoisomerase VI subunit B
MSAYVTSTTKRLTFSTSHLADFTSTKGLVALVGVEPEDWPLVIFKELIDNAADACEDAGIAPHVKLAIEDGAIVVEDNGPGVDPDVVRRVCDYSQNTSRNAAYVGPTRGQQGNALQTLFAMPYVAHEGHDAVGVTIIESQGVRHMITFTADPVTREPKLDYEATETAFTDGTRVTVNWPNSLADDYRLVGYASRFLWFNPHLSLTIDGRDFGPSKADWSKWKPGGTSAHWYGLDQFKRLIGARAANGPEATVRDFVRMFDGLTAKDRAAAIIGALNAECETLAEFAGSGDKRIERLLAEMQQHSKAVAPERLGVLGRNHLADAARRFGVADLSRFEYRRAAYVADADGLPYVAEVAFAYAPHLSRRFVLAG